MVRRLWRTLSAQPAVRPFTEWRIWVRIDPALADAARVRFAATPHVTILQVNSGELLRRAIASLTEPALFWLDGHYSGSITARGGVANDIITWIGPGAASA
jgi:hypothetical protein